MSSSSSRPYDITIFGATGFTGQYIAQYLINYVYQHKMKINIALSGRDESRLTSLHQRLTTNTSTLKVGIIIANTDDSKSMIAMTSQTSVVINATGPFRFYGEAVVSACIQTKTNYVDITGEPEFIERMILKYDDEARKAGVFIIPSCGFDSIPSDLGAIYTTNEWEKLYPSQPLRQIDSYITFHSGSAGASLNYGTWASLVHGIAHAKDLSQIRSQLKQKQEAEAGKVPRVGAPPKPHSLSWESCVNRWTIRFMGADASVVRLSQQRLKLQDDKNKEKHTYPYYNVYLTISSIWWILVMGFLGAIFKCFASGEWGRLMLLKHPSWFTLGLLSTSGPTPQQIAEARFEMEMFATDGKQQLHTVISGPEMGYDATSRIICQSAITVLEEIRIPAEKRRLARGEPGGVMTPAGAFATTDLIHKLHQEQVKFQVVEAGAVKE